MTGRSGPVQKGGEQMRRVRFGFGAALLAAVALVASSCGGSSRQSSAPRSTPQPEASTWSLPNATRQNTRAISSSITSANVSKLRVAWRLPLKHAGGFGYYANTPVFGADGTVYLQDLAYNVLAVDGKTGKTLWTHSSGRNGASLSSLPIGEGPNGVALVNGTLYGEMRAHAFALAAATGKQLWRTANLAEKKGKILWKFQETKNPAERSAGGANGTGGAWNTPAVGPDGTVYFGIANPYRSIDQAINRPPGSPTTTARSRSTRADG